MPGQVSVSADNPVLRCLAYARHRLVLQLLSAWTSAVTLDELATHLVADEQDKSLVEVSRFEVQSVRKDLIHRHLPKLDETDLVAWDRVDETVDTTNHPALPDPKLQRMLDTDADEWEEVLANLAYRRRRIILSVLKDNDDEMARDELADAVLARERSDVGDGGPTGTSDELVAELHHVHLPKLQQANLVAYDPDAGGVTYLSHPELEDEWLDFRVDETPRAILPDAHHSDAIWTIEGRDNVIARGQSLFEQTDEELFLMFTTDGLLEDGCIRRLQNAIDRGVDVYLGSQTADVRDLVRERIPDAVIWEPQMDWLNLPPEYEKVGRLVFADREAIMLATLGEKANDGVHAETAITGSGQNNPFVVLMRDMLGSRLDHLDSQSADFVSEVPL